MVGKIRDMVETRIASYLALAKKAGQVTSGGDMVTDALRKQRAAVVLVACDISPDIGEKIGNSARRAGAACYRLLDKEHLGDMLGKELRSVAAIDKGGIAETVIKEMDKYRNFFEGGAQGR
jgi:ribosomal protein L7Ae-like RNA K-turn-binding protein